MKIRTTVGGLARMLGLDEGSGRGNPAGYVPSRSVEVEFVDDLDRITSHTFPGAAGTAVRSVGEAQLMLRAAQTFDSPVSPSVRLSGVPVGRQRVLEAALRAGQQGPRGVLTEAYTVPAGSVVAESAGLLTRSSRVAVAEARPVRAREVAGDGMFELQLISPGVGSCGYYSPEVLEAAGRAGVFAAETTQMFLDHPTASEAAERPERSVRDLAGKLVETGRWNGSAIVAKAHVYSTYRPLLAEAAPDIGLSIRAVGDVTSGTYNGQTMPIVESLAEVLSVDFVTKAGRGGRVLSILESPRGRLPATAPVRESDRMFPRSTTTMTPDDLLRKACGAFDPSPFRSGGHR